MSKNPCLSCKFAKWNKTASGRLHPDGYGRCEWKMPEITIPAAYYFIGSTNMKKIPPMSGGVIERKHWRDNECPTREPLES